jgi:leucyl-tRNA synthetase
LSEYQKAPAVTRDRMYLETMQQIFTSTSKVLMDTKQSNNMIYLPIDKMISLKQIALNQLLYSLLLQRLQNKFHLWRCVTIKMGVPEILVIHVTERCADE